MKTTVRVLLMSQLSDLQPMLNKEKCSEKDKHTVNFMKYIIAKFPSTDMEIDADEEFKRYLKLLK